MTQWRVQVSLYEKRWSSHQQQVLCPLTHTCISDSLWCLDGNNCKSSKACWKNQLRPSADTHRFAIAYLQAYIYRCRDDTAQRNTPLRSCNFAQRIDALLKLPTARCCTYFRAVKQHAGAQRQLHTTRHNHFPYAVALTQLMTMRRRANKSKSFF